MTRVAATALVAALVAGVQAAQAQANGAGEESRIAEALRGLGLRLESINESSGGAFWVSFWAGVAVALVAVAATCLYSWQLKRSTEHLEEQVRHTEEHLEIVREDAGNRLRPMLSWARHDDGEPFAVPKLPDRRQDILVRVVNSGEVAAVDIVASREARIVGNDGTTGTPVRDVANMGSLEPHKSMEVRVPVSTETLARAMAGETAYVEVSIAYRMGRTREFRYRVGGYLSNTVSFLFKALDEEVPPKGTEPEIPENAAGTGAPARPGELGTGRVTGGGILSRLGSIAEKRHMVLGGGEAGEASEAEQARRVRPAGADPARAAIHMKRGMELHGRGMHAEALAELLQAERLDRADTRALYSKADALDKLGRYDEEIRALGRILEREGENVDVNAKMAGLCVALGHYDAAYSALSRIHLRDPGYDVCMDMATVSMALRQYESAIIDFGGAIHARPDDPGAHYGKGVAQLNDRCDEETLATLGRAAELDPARADAHVTLAHALLRLGRRKEAVEALGKAIGASPNDQRARVNAGKIMMDIGNREEARKAFAEARRLDSSLLVPMDAGEGGDGGGGRQ